ncbi:unnamed protein product [Lupinus luteus]|uniref:Aluminum-activated malate transporter n=1 Tax=Lupinus luteus TaxID=3873 RepID=A0AAV1XLE1_LUPLU
MASLTTENAKPFSLASRWLRSLPKKSCAKVTNLAKNAKKLGQDDPRRITHSLKVGLALTLVSMLFYVQPLYDSFGSSTMWAIMTVVVVMEFSVGATLGKGINRMLATLLGGSLGFGVQQLATLTEKEDHSIVIAFSLYIIGAIMTFVRFFPGVKAKYDYGFSIFILTFSLVSISGYRDDYIQILACKRILTIIIGSFLAMIVSICIWPVWIGEDLHNLVASNIEKLGDFLEGFGGEDYFDESDGAKPVTNKSFADKYEIVLNSKTREETMANLAGWEACHGRFRFRHPWKQYLKVGNLTRKCAYKIEALDCYIRCKIWKISNDPGNKIKDSCQHGALESGKALKELSSAIKSMSWFSTTTKAHIANAKGAIKSLNSILKENPREGIDILEIVAIVAVASLLTDVIISIERISEAVDGLASLAHFKMTTINVTQPLPLQREGTIQPIMFQDELLYNFSSSTSLNNTRFHP